MSDHDDKVRELMEIEEKITTLYKSGGRLDTKQYAYYRQLRHEVEVGERREAVRP